MKFRLMPLVLIRSGYFFNNLTQGDSLTAFTDSDVAHTVDTVRRCIAETERDLAEVLRLLSGAKSLTRLDIADNARALHREAQALRYWTATRVRG